MPTAEEIYQQAKQDSEKAIAKADAMVDKMVQDTEYLIKKSQENFSQWRDFLYKYYLIIMAVIGGTGLFASSEQLKNYYISLGLFLCLFGIIIGFLLINVYFYFERKTLQIESYITNSNPYKLYEHPDVENNIILAMKLNLKNVIKNNENLLKNTKEKKKINALKIAVKADKRMVGLLKYFGGNFGGIIERTWFSTVIISFILSSAGLFLILYGIIATVRLTAPAQF